MKLKIEPDQKTIAKALKGKTIARVAMRAWDPNREGSSAIRDEPNYDPIIYFTDGTSLTFNVQESESGEYGVSLSLFNRRNKCSP